MDECGTKSQKSSEHNRNLVNSIFQDFEAGKPQIEDNGQLEEDPGARDVNGKNVSPDCNWTSPDDEKKCDDDLKKTEGPAFVLAEIDEKSQESTEEQLEPIELDERLILRQFFLAQIGALFNYRPHQNLDLVPCLLSNYRSWSR